MMILNILYRFTFFDASFRKKIYFMFTIDTFLMILHLGAAAKQKTKEKLVYKTLYKLSSSLSSTSSTLP
jgi:hypothetical protein